MSNKNNDLKLIYKIGKLFQYKEVIITHEYSSFIIFKNNYTNISNTYLLSKFFNKTIYNYLKYGTKLYNDNKYINYKLGYWYLDKFFNKKLNNNIIQHLPFELKQYKTYKELFIIVIEKYFYYYNTIIYLFDTDIFEYEYLIYNIHQESTKIEDIEHIKQDKEYNLIYRDSILRKN